MYRKEVTCTCSCVANITIIYVRNVQGNQVITKMAIE